jgi:hypothetical protein
MFEWVNDKVKMFMHAKFRMHVDPKLQFFHILNSCTLM